MADIVGFAALGLAVALLYVYAEYKLGRFLKRLRRSRWSYDYRERNPATPTCCAQVLMEWRLVPCAEAGGEMLMACRVCGKASPWKSHADYRRWLVVHSWSSWEDEPALVKGGI